MSAIRPKNGGSPQTEAEKNSLICISKSPGLASHSCPWQGAELGVSAKLACAVAPLVTTSLFMTNISMGVYLNSISILLSPRRLSSSGTQQDSCKENNIYTQTSYMCGILASSVVIRLFFILCIKSAPNSLRLSFRLDPSPPPNPKWSSIPPPICPPYMWWLFLAVFSSKGPSLSLPLAFVAEMCYQPLTSPPSLQNCAPIDFFS